MTIRTKRILTTAGLTLIPIIMFISTWIIISSQKHDSLIINLAGRQRMLSQKMTKEFLFYQSSKAENKNNLDKIHADLMNTMQVFDATLMALKDSGKAPLSLNMKKSSFEEIPSPPKAIRDQLTIVFEIWKEFSAHMKSSIKDQDLTGEKKQWIMSNNIPLLVEMNKAVVMFQHYSEKKSIHLL